MKTSRGFTLIELLLVISIIILLLSLMIPSVQSALERAREVKCKNNLRIIAAAMISFADDHGGRFPGSTGIGRGPSDWQRSWMGEEAIVEEYRHLVHPQMDKKKRGTLTEYLGISGRAGAEIYRCPSHTQGKAGSGVGSNGMFDYSMIQSWGGVMISRIPPACVVYRGTPREAGMVTPLVVEEDPGNNINAAWIECGHGNTDRIGRWHRGGRGFYAGVDGSVGTVASPNGLGPRTGIDCEVMVGGKWRQIGPSASKWGDVPW